MSKFNIGDIVYLNKRGIFHNDNRDWSLMEPLIKNKKYVVTHLTKHRFDDYNLIRVNIAQIILN